MFFPIFFYLIISCSICGSEGQENGSENQLFIRQPIFPAENFMNASSTFDYIRAAEGLLRILETEEKFNEKVKETFGKEIKENRKKLEEFKKKHFFDNSLLSIKNNTENNVIEKSVIDIGKPIEQLSSRNICAQKQAPILLSQKITKAKWENMFFTESIDTYYKKINIDLLNKLPSLRSTIRKGYKKLYYEEECKFWESRKIENSEALNYSPYYTIVASPIAYTYVAGCFFGNKIITIGKNLEEQFKEQRSLQKLQEKQSNKKHLQPEIDSVSNNQQKKDFLSDKIDTKTICLQKFDTKLRKKEEWIKMPQNFTCQKIIKKEKYPEVEDELNFDLFGDIKDVADWIFDEIDEFQR